MTTRTGIHRWLLRLLLAAALVCAPVTFVSAPDGVAKLRPAMAHAKDGDSDDGDDDDDRSGSDRDEDDGGRGRGRGRGRGGDDPDQATGNRGAPAGGDGCVPGASSGPSCAVPSRGGVRRVEVSSGGIDVRYSDGARERIERGRYELRDAAGRTLERRRATGADVSRLRALAESATVRGASSAQGGDRTLRALTVRDGNMLAEYANGWSEEVRDGRYRLIDPYGRVVARRAATDADRARILAGGS